MSSSTPARHLPNGISRITNGTGGGGGARRTASMTRDGAIGAGLGEREAEEDAAEDPVQMMLRERWAQAEAKIAALFGTDGQTRRASRRPTPQPDGGAAHARFEEHAKTSPPPKKAARQIDDDYGDDDDEEEEEEGARRSPLMAKSKAALPNGLSPRAVRSPAPVSKPPAARTSTTSSSDQAKSSEDVRKQLEEDKAAAAERAKRSFQAMFYTLESDRDAMLEQQKLDELDREVENEISGGPNGTQGAQQDAAASTSAPTQGTLGSADLGASSLTLKHLIARIDMKRDMVRASDNQLRTLISEVRKGRSKWASEEKVGQEELYEAAEKVLMELKAMTEYAQPFLVRVNKRDAPDYYHVISRPMDIGTMIKKLKQLSYKSKREFVDDLNLIWANCLKYNSNSDHPYRKKALYMRKETDKLTPLIPEIVVRDRAEVEAEERRQHSLDADDSDEEDEPIMASRGRKAPAKGTGSKGAPSAAQKAPSVNVDDASTPEREVKPAVHASASHLRNEFLRADSEMQDASSAGFSTPPPPGTATPNINGVHASGTLGSQVDVTEVDGMGNSVISAQSEEADEDDPGFKTWKQVTKKDRALAASDRNRLFRGEHLNVDEPALLRSKAAMRRWMRQQREISADKAIHDGDIPEGDEQQDSSAPGETLAEGIEKDEDSTLPDYYNPLSAIPDLNERWRWTTDSEGKVVPQSEDWMRMYPKEQYKSPEGALSQRMKANMRQMQETRKVCSKIGIVKQMQLQGQTYQNQFQKYEPMPFVEQDVGAVVVSEAGPLMAPWVNRAALQSSIGKLFYHAGFEDFQPSAMDTITDLAGDYFRKLTEGLRAFREQPKTSTHAPRFSFEEQVLHALYEGGQDIEGLETYAKDDVERLSTKLGVVHDRMRSHLSDLLVKSSNVLSGECILTLCTATRSGRQCRRRRCWSFPGRQRRVRSGRLCTRDRRRLLRSARAWPGGRARSRKPQRASSSAAKQDAQRVPGTEPRSNDQHWDRLPAARALRSSNN